MGREETDLRCNESQVGDLDQTGVSLCNTPDKTASTGG